MHEVTPSEAPHGLRRKADVCGERVESTRVSPNDTPSHERPALDDGGLPIRPRRDEDVLRHPAERPGGGLNSHHNRRRRSRAAELPELRDERVLPQGGQRALLQLLRRRQVAVPGSDLVRAGGRWHPRVRFDDALPHERGAVARGDPQVGEADSDPGALECWRAPAARLDELNRGLLCGLAEAALPRGVRAAVSRDTDLELKYLPGEGRKAGTAQSGRAIREAPALLTSEVILSQAAEGAAQADGSAEGAETTGPSPNGNDPHERPALGTIRDDDIVRHSSESRRVRPNSVRNYQGHGVLQAHDLRCARLAFGERDHQDRAVHSQMPSGMPYGDVWEDRNDATAFPWEIRVLALPGREIGRTPKGETRDVQ